MNDKLRRRSTRFCLLFAVLVLISLSSIFAHYRFVDVSQVCDPYRLSVYDYQNKKYLLVDRTDSIAQELLREAYCPEYRDYLMARDVQLSPGGIALPTIRAGEQYYMLNESGRLRYELWKKAPPQVVLLGSSWMFQGFNRRTFFDRYPHIRLLDFSVCGNTPFTTQEALKQLEGRQCEVKPGTVFLYGINVVELTPWYEGNKVAFVQDSLAEPPHRIARELHVLESGVSDFRNKIRASVKSAIVPPKANAPRPYLFQVPEEYVADPARLKAWLCELEPRPNVTPKIKAPFDEKRVDALRWIARWVKERHAKLVLIRIPTSTLSINACLEDHHNFDLQIGELVRELDVPYFDLGNHETTGIHDGHFVYPGNLFNPDHLNYAGAVKLTTHLIAEMDRDWFAPLLQPKGTLTSRQAQRSGD